MMPREETLIRKEELEKNIKFLLGEFTDQTGFLVKDINLISMQISKDKIILNTSYKVEIEVHM